MDETKFEDRFSQLEKRVSDGFVRMEDGFARMETLIETLANTCAREFASIAERFAAVDQRFVAVDERLAAIEGSIEDFSHRVDREVEERHVLAQLSRTIGRVPKALTRLQVYMEQSEYSATYIIWLC
jgi:hypothetical protein